MNIFHAIRTGLVATALLTGLVACTSLSDKEAKELLPNPSLHILVNDNVTIPTSGTFDFDTKFFKVNYSEKINVADVDKRITDALKDELKRRGYTRDTDSPILLVSYAVALDAEISSAEFDKAYGNELPITIPKAKEFESLHYRRGVLIVDVLDAASRTLLWRGSIMAKLDMNVDNAAKERRTRLAVRTLLQHFPKPITRAPAK